MGIRAGASVYFVDSSMTRLAAWNFHDQSAVFWKIKTQPKLQRSTEADVAFGNWSRKLWEEKMKIVRKNCFEQGIIVIRCIFQSVASVANAYGVDLSLPLQNNPKLITKMVNSVPSRDLRIRSSAVLRLGVEYIFTGNIRGRDATVNTRPQNLRGHTVWIIPR